MKIMTICTVIVFVVMGIVASDVYPAELEKEFSRVFDFESGGEFTLENYRGRVTVRSGDYYAIEVNAVIKVNYNDEEVAQELLESTSIEIRNAVSSDVDIMVDVDKELIDNLKKGGFWDLFNVTSGPILTIDFDVKVPRTVNLDIKSERGPVDIRDIDGTVRTKNHRGTVFIEQVTGMVTAETERAGMELIRIDGNIRAKNHRGGITIDLAKGNVIAETERAPMKLIDIGGNVEAKNHRGKIHIEQVQGLVTAETERAPMELIGIAKDVSAKNHRGGINIEQTGGTVDAENERAPMEFIGIGSDIRAKNHRGGITIEQAVGSVFAESERGHIRAEVARATDGAIYDFKNHRGYIEVFLPENVGADVTIEIEKGELETEFPLEIMGTLSKKHVEGKINTGGIPLRIRNSVGSVALKKL